jgi:SpoIID/LytB domain protein
MSQYGAQEMALKGYDYAEILQYYYRGIDLKEAY